MQTSFEIALGIGYLTTREVEALKQIARLLPRGAVCVNIGSGAGTSVIALLEERPDITIYDVDLTLENGKAQLRETGFMDAAQLKRIEGDSKAVGRAWAAGALDYLFIDGDHSAAGIQGDYEAWLCHVKPGGFVAVHDYWPYPADHALAGRLDWPDVARVTDAVMLPYTVFLDMDRLRIFQLSEKAS